MASIKSNDISKALNKKGFLEEEKKHHTYYYFTDRFGRSLPIYTYLSRGSGMEYDDFLLGQMATQLKIKRKKLIELIKCTYKEAAYREFLEEAGESPTKK